MIQIAFDLKSQSLIGGEGPLKLEWVSDGTLAMLRGAIRTEQRKRRAKKQHFEAREGDFGTKS